MQNVQVLRVTDSGYYSDANTSGSTVAVTLKRKNAHGGYDLATCDGILIWEDELADNDLFDEWVACAQAGEEGYMAMLNNGETTVLY